MLCMGLHLVNLLPHVSVHQGYEVWRQHTNEYGSKWISNLIDRRFLMGESTGIPLNQKNRNGSISQQHHEASAENYTDHGPALTKLSTSSLMSPAISKM